MCFKKKKKTTTVSTAPSQAVQNLYTTATDATAAAAAKPYISFGTQASDYVAPLTDQQKAGMAGVDAAVGGYTPYMNAGVNATGAGLGYMNTGVGTVGQGVDAVNAGIKTAKSGLTNIKTGEGYVKKGMGSIDQGTEATKTGMGPANLGSLNIQQYLSPYLSEVRDSTAALMNQANNQAQSQALGTAISSGAFGGDRAGIAAANLNQQNQLAMANAMSNISNQGYQFATDTAQGQQAADLAARQANLQRILQGGAQFGVLGTQQGQLGAAAGTLGAQKGQIGASIGNMGAQLGTLGTQQGDLGTSVANVGKQLADFGTTKQTLDLQAANAQLNAGALEQENKQAGIDAMIKRYQQEQGYDFQTAQFMANQYATLGPLYGSTTTTVKPTNIFGNPVQTGGRVNGYAKGGGISGPMTMSQMPLYEESYIPERIFSTSPMLTGEEAREDEKKKGNFISTALNIASFLSGRAEGGAVNDRHGYATDGSVLDPKNRIGLAEALIAEILGDDATKLPVSDGRDGYMPSSRLVLGTNPQYPGSKILSPLTTEQLRNNINDPDYYDVRGYETARNLAYARGQEKTNPANMGYMKSHNMGMPSQAHPYPPSPTTGVVPAPDTAARYTLPTTTGVAARQPSATFQISPEEKAANRAMMARALGAREPRANERYMLPTGLSRPPVNALDELNFDDPYNVAATIDENTRPSFPRLDLGNPPPERSEMLSLPQPPSNYRPTPAETDANVKVSGLAPAGGTVPNFQSGLAPTTSPRPQPRPADLGTSPAAVDNLTADALAAIGRTSDGLKIINVGPTPMDTEDGIPPAHIPTAWDVDKVKISKRESGGDPNALLSFANREGGQFSGVKVTDMTVDQAIEFARPGGAYANYSRTQTEDGRVATPMGEYQIVGDTLANAKRAMGLTGNEVMTPEVQEQIAKHLYDTRGMQPWAASEGTTGGLGGGRTSTSEGLGGADMARQDNDPLRINKPYKDRNLIGKFFHNPDTGKLDRNAIMSLLSGVGGMVSSDSLSPLTALLQGAAVGSETYKGLLKQDADVGFTEAQTATEVIQLLEKSIYYDANLGMSLIPLANGSVQSLADFMSNPAGPSMAGPAMDRIFRNILGGAAEGGVDLTTAKPQEILSEAPLPTSQGTTTETTAAGMPVPPVVTPYESFGTFPMGDAEQAYIAQAETRARMAINPIERQAVIERSEASRAAADAGTASASLAFRNTNELAATVAKAAAGNDLGPLGGVKATYEALASQVADMFGIQYDGGAATSQTLLNKLSSLSADQMTADTAAASLYLQNKNIFPNIDTDPTAAADITAEMLTRNMLAYEKGQYINDIYRAQRGVVKDLTGVDALFTKEAGNIYQGEKANIAALLKYAGNAEADPEVKSMIVDFFEGANKGAFTDPADAQAALEAIFTVLPDQNSVSSGLGRYFVQ